MGNTLFFTFDWIIYLAVYTISLLGIAWESGRRYEALQNNNISKKKHQG